LVDRFPVVRFRQRRPIRHKLPESVVNNNFDCLIECRVCGKLQGFCPDWHWVVICRQHEAAVGLAHYFKQHRQSVREANRQVIERRLFAGLQFQFHFRQRLSAIADNNEPFVESHLDQGSFEIEAPQTPLDLRLKLLLERVSIDDLAEQVNVGIGARHANLRLAAGKRCVRKRPCSLETHNVSAAYLPYPKNNSLFAKIACRRIKIDGS
jgi:hypothetical protein